MRTDSSGLSFPFSNIYVDLEIWLDLGLKYNEYYLSFLPSECSGSITAAQVSITKPQVKLYRVFSFQRTVNNRYV